MSGGRNNTSAASVDEWLSRLTVQDTIFAKLPRRADLRRILPTWPLQSLRLFVHRNFAAELVLSLTSPFLNWAGWDIKSVSFGAYDDALTFQSIEDADVHVVLLDFDRYQEAEVASWLPERIGYLRSVTDSPILIPGPCAGRYEDSLEAAVQLPGVFVCDLSGVTTILGPRARDERSRELAGTAFSPEAMLLMAQRLGLVGLPAAAGARIRAVVVDLDNTIVGGVLAEVGVEGLDIGESFQSLHRSLLAIRERGVFLAILSRNERGDVDRLFDERADMVLRPEHFSSAAVDWNGKPSGMQSILASLRIAPDQVLVVDDNAGEIASLAAAFPTLRFLHAVHPASTSEALNMYPGLVGLRRSATDTVRLGDLSANAVRDDIKLKSADFESYLESLRVTLTVSTSTENLPRVAELSMKTNQFNTAMRRFSEPELLRAVQQGTAKIATVALSDRLSDSGVVAAATGHIQDGGLIVDDLCISCRALGRGVEDLIIEELLGALGGRTRATACWVLWAVGPRNAPALTWLSAHSKSPLEGNSGRAEVDWGGPDQATREWPVLIRRELSQ